MKGCFCCIKPRVHSLNCTYGYIVLLDMVIFMSLSGIYGPCAHKYNGSDG